MFWCGDPICIDKSGDWGVGNTQTHPNGAWVQINKDGEVSHLVADASQDVDGGLTTSPVGWTRVLGSYNAFVKNHIWAVQIPDRKVHLSTLDGDMIYDNPNSDGWVLYNTNAIGEPDFSDPWFMTYKEFTETYKEMNNE